MKMNLVKRENAADLVMILMIWALASLLSTRLFLNLTGWPTIHFGIWHIAHVLWGGFLMLIGMIMLLINYGNKIRKTSAAIAGIGWGLFIDEIGKYLTKNNDYWFQPAIIFIYISFIALFLVYRYLEKHNPKNSKIMLYSILEQLEEIIEEGNLENRDKKELMKKLNWLLGHEKNPEKKQLAKILLAFVKKSKVRPDDQNTFWNKIRNNIEHSYSKIFKQKVVLFGLGIYSVYYALDKIIEAILIATNSQKMAVIQKFYSDYDLFSKADTYMIWLKIIFDTIVSLFFLFGLSLIAGKKKIKGLTFFQYGLLINIFLSSVFRFYFEQFSAVFGLFLAFVVYEGISRLKREIKSNSVV